MTALKSLGFALIALSIAAFVFYAVNESSQERLDDVGRIQSGLPADDAVPLPAIVAVASMAAGALILVFTRRQRGIYHAPRVRHFDTGRVRLVRTWPANPKPL